MRSRDIAENHGTSTTTLSPSPSITEENPQSFYDEPPLTSIQLGAGCTLSIHPALLAVDVEVAHV